MQKQDASENVSYPFDTLDKSLTGIQHDVVLQDRSRRNRYRWKGGRGGEGKGGEGGEESYWECVRPNCAWFMISFCLLLVSVPLDGVWNRTLYTDIKSNNEIINWEREEGKTRRVAKSENSSCVIKAGLCCMF